MIFDTVAMVDWSSGADTGPRPRKDAVWSAVARGGRVAPPVYHRNRRVAEAWIADLVAAELAAGRRLALGFDFPFGYPAGFAAHVVGRADPLALHDWFAAALDPAADGRDRFDVAAGLNARFPGTGPFWFNGLSRDIDGLPRRGRDRAGHGMVERRTAEARAAGAFPLWQMGGAGAVGGQAMTGMAALSRLRARFGHRMGIWPFQPADRPVAVLEIWPSLIAAAVRRAEAAHPCRDAAQVAVMAGAFAALPPDALAAMLDDAGGRDEEGWILGLGHEDALDAAAAEAATAEGAPADGAGRLRNDCFALPPGVDWTPVDAALDLLRARLRPVTGTERVALADAAGRVLAGDVTARRSNPPAANAAVDGWGVAAATLDGVSVKVAEGRAAAGAPFGGRVPEGQALRVLTGALLPDGVDTVVLEEETRREGDRVILDGLPRPGANTRPAGEDVEAGAIALAAGRRLRAPDLALLAATGHGDVVVRRRLRIGVLSTGDELAPPGTDAGPDRTYDANRPMLLALARDWGAEAVDLGHAADDPGAVRAALDRGADAADMVLTTGGASAGDEDHVSRLLRAEGDLATWRIAVKPGRPLALAIWKGAAVFGLPGNPVAAFVCALVFARPAASVMAGAGWVRPLALTVPAAFAKRKKAGRREYLRARLDADGRAEVFASEGSGRISGLSWADGLVELDDGARDIAPGDPVRFLPYAGFGVRD